MRTLVLGAGALGGYFGARLLAAGRDVTFLVRPARAALLAQHGLNILSPRGGGDLHLPAPATVLAEALHEPYDLILLSSKAYDLNGAMDSFAAAVGEQTAILPLLNGMAHMDALDARFGRERVLGGASIISATLDPDGTIRHLNDRDTLLFGARPHTVPEKRVAAVAEVLLDANFAAAQPADILAEMWNKWMFIATLAGGTCLLRANIGEIAAAGASSMVLALAGECMAVAQAEGHTPGEQFLAMYRPVLTQAGSPLAASMLRDLEAGAPIERQQIIGDLLERGRRHGLPVPMLEIADAHLRAYEARRQRQPDA